MIAFRDEERRERETRYRQTREVRVSWERRGRGGVWEGKDGEVSGIEMVLVQVRPGTGKRHRHRHRHREAGGEGKGTRKPTGKIWHSRHSRNR